MLKRTLFLVVIATSTLALAQTPGIVFERNVAMKTRDGVTLHADIYRPRATASIPGPAAAHALRQEQRRQFRQYAPPRRGFMVVVQDVRGRYTSEGEWYPFKHETDDGYDTVEWAAALPYSNGKVGMLGGSYVGATQMLAAIAPPSASGRHLPRRHRQQLPRELDLPGRRVRTVVQRVLDLRPRAGHVQSRRPTQSTNALAAAMSLPLTQLPAFSTRPACHDRSPTSPATFAPYFLDWLATSHLRRLLEAVVHRRELSPNIQVPALTIAAWYDIFLGRLAAQLHRPQSARRQRSRAQRTASGRHHRRPRRRRPQDRRPWTSALQPLNTMKTTSRSSGTNTSSSASRTSSPAKPVRIFVMGENQWRDEDAWPLERAKPPDIYLHSAGKANTPAGDGILSTPRSPSEAQTHFVYDPANPVPTVGGPLCCDSQHLPPGPRDQREVEARKDVLVYSTTAARAGPRSHRPRHARTLRVSHQPSTPTSLPSSSTSGPMATRRI